ncbi:MAG TPA: hypothetical protein VGO96_18650 [Pyrinomonadaceae bacterium]|jgi:hypothetical protein|nr:hypothetical protein [Pyrinomonadaceae bacterium]
MSTNDPNYPQTAPAASDPPIIVHGGSVSVDVPPGFDAPAGSKKYKNDKVQLVSLQINEDTPIQLNKDDKITITYK